MGEWPSVQKLFHSAWLPPAKDSIQELGDGLVEIGLKGFQRHFGFSMGKSWFSSNMFTQAEYGHLGREWSHSSLKIRSRGTSLGWFVSDWPMMKSTSILRSMNTTLMTSWHLIVFWTGDGEGHRRPLETTVTRCTCIIKHMRLWLWPLTLGTFERVTAMDYF